MSSLFGTTTTQNAAGGSSLFGGGGGTNTTQNAPGGGGLFGSSTQQPQQQQQSSSLFGNTATQNQAQSTQPTSLFGRPAAQNTSSGGLFGGQQQNAPAQSTSLFGAPAQQTQPQQQQPPQSLFGAQPQNTTTAPNPGGSLFSQSVPQRSTAERTFTNPQQTHLSTLLQSGLGTNPSAFGSLGLTSQNDLAKSRLQAAGLNAVPNDKNVLSQVQTLVRKWDPRSQSTLMQSYLYNAVNAAYAPFYYRSAEEGEEEWEEALRKKPKEVDLGGGERVAFVPVMVRGFFDLGKRVEYQATIVGEMRRRLHEMNNSLDAVMGRHQQNVSVRLENARRQHAALSQRCLRLAVKTQVLRHRGYPLDQSEEGLRKSLQQLERTVMDPSFAAREEEIWARMVALRERSRWLEEETKRLGGILEQQGEQANGNANSNGVSEEVLLKTKKILGDYSGQLAHLTKELEEVKKEFEEWENSRRR